MTFTVNKLRFHGGSNRTLVKWMNNPWPVTILIDEDGMPSSRNPERRREASEPSVLFI